MSRRRFVLAALCVLIVAGCGAPDPRLSATAQPAGDGPDGSLLFVTDGHVALWHDGDIHQLTDDGVAAYPVWAPDGGRFAYVDMHDGYSDLRVADRDGHELRAVTADEPDDPLGSEDWALHAAWALTPAWSPDGQQLVFVSDRDRVDVFNDPLTLWLADPWTAEPAPIPATQALDRTYLSPTFAPDGRRLAFVARNRQSADELGSIEIWTLDLASGDIATLVAGVDAAYAPAWSPVGNEVAYIQRAGKAEDVWIAPTDGSPAYQLTALGDVAAVAWSPDGRYLAVIRQQDAGFAVWTAAISRDPDGRLRATEPERLFAADGIDANSGLSWSNT